MIKTYARIEAGRVAELFTTDGDITQMFHPDLVWIEVDSTVQIGDRCEGGHFSRPAPDAPASPSVPQSVTRLQAKAALLQAGLLDAANAHFAQAGADPLARLAWAEATTFERDSRLVAATATALNLSSAQLDDLFRTAATIEV